MAAKCPAFKSGRSFKGCETVGEFEDKLGEMRNMCKGVDAYLVFLRVIHLTAKGKEADVEKFSNVADGNKYMYVWI